MQESRAAVDLFVAAPADGVDIQCESAVAVDEEVKCNGTVLGGSFLNATTDWGDGVRETFRIAGVLMNSPFKHTIFGSRCPNTWLT